MSYFDQYGNLEDEYSQFGTFNTDTGIGGDGDTGGGYEGAVEDIGGIQDEPTQFAQYGGDGDTLDIGADEYGGADEEYGGEGGYGIADENEGVSDLDRLTFDQRQQYVFEDPFIKKIKEKNKSTRFYINVLDTLNRYTSDDDLRNDIKKWIVSTLSDEQVSNLNGKASALALLSLRGAEVEGIECKTLYRYKTYIKKISS